MKYAIAFTLLVALSSMAKAADYESVEQKILDAFSMKEVKTQFKVFHYLFKKQYNLDSEEGIRRYKNFKANVKEINEHNASQSSFKMGINHLTDMTDEEIIAHYNLKTVSEKEFKGRFLGMFDDYEDEEELNSEKKAIKTQTTENLKINPIDWTSFMLDPRDQGDCGSCYAFATVGTLEGNWNIKNPEKRLKEYLSVQHLIDCDLSNQGCRGGIYENSFPWYQKNFAMTESKYKYIAKRTMCKDWGTNYTSVRLGEFASATKDEPEKWANLITNGPVAVPVEANRSMFKYKTGIWDGECATGFNHAVILVGYGVENGVGYYLIKNSWGTKWGEKGYIKVKQNRNNGLSCYIEKAGFVPLSFK